MSVYESISSAVALVAAVGGLFGVFFVGAQVRQGAKNTKEATEARQREWDLRRREASMQFYTMTLSSRQKLKTRLPPDRDATAIDSFVRAAESDPAKLDVIRTHLSYYEMLATGVLSGVFDEEIVDRFGGGPIIAAWINYEPWVNARRIEFNAPSMFEELEELAQKLADRRGVSLVKLRESRSLPAHGDRPTLAPTD